jgi:hypothetical protein
MCGGWCNRLSTDCSPIHDDFGPVFVVFQFVAVLPQAATDFLELLKAQESIPVARRAADEFRDEQYQLFQRLTSA